MFLLPDILVDRVLLSTQYPFTLNGELITNIETELSSNDYNITFKTTTYEYHISLYKYKFLLRSAIYDQVDILSNDYTNSQDYNIFFNELIQHTNHNRLFGFFMDKLCDQVNNGNPSSLYSLLVAQHRCSSYLDQHKYYTSKYIYVDGHEFRKLSFQQIIDDAFLSTFGRSLLYVSSSHELSRGHRSMVTTDAYLPLNQNGYTIMEKSKNNKNYIHPYNYKPVYIPHYMENEDNATTLLLGVEIEVGGSNHGKSEHNNVVKKCIQIINGSDSDKEDLIYSTYDSTVEIEFDTMPCSLEFHKHKMNYKQMFEYLDQKGYKGHDCNSAGLHIHVNRSYLGKSSLIQELVISKILYILEKFNDNICVIARRNNDYSKFVGDKKDEVSAVELYGKYKNFGKRAALNLNHPDTIEFRMFRSTLKYETFILTLEFVKDIVDFAKSVQIEDIENIKWEDLMKTFSLDLKKYYTFRLSRNSNEAILKKKIASLKKQIKNCKNSFILKTLNSELSCKQAELKRCLKIKRMIDKKLLPEDTLFNIEEVGTINHNITFSSSALDTDRLQDWTVNQPLTFLV